MSPLIPPSLYVNNCIKHLNKYIKIHNTFWGTWIETTASSWLEIFLLIIMKKLRFASWHFSKHLSQRSVARAVLSLRDWSWALEGIRRGGGQKQFFQFSTYVSFMLHHQARIPQNDVSSALPALYSKSRRSFTNLVRHSDTECSCPPEICQLFQFRKKHSTAKGTHMQQEEAKCLHTFYFFFF